ncbi:MAG: glycosyltransferase family 4 protein [Oligosphaeraceae bacterium]
MRLLLSLYRYFPAGGLQMDALRIAQAACRRGHQVVFLTTSWQGAPPELPGFTLRLAPPLHAWGNLSRMAAFGRAVEEFRRRESFDGDLAMNRIPGALYYFAGDECMKRLLLRRPGGWLLRHLPRYHALLAQEKSTLLSPRTRKILVISPRQQRDFQEEYALPPEKLLLLPPGMDPGSLPPGEPEERERLRRQEREALGIPPEDRMFLMVGSNLLLKGVDRGLAAVASLPPEERRRCHVVLLGRNDPRRFLALARKSGIAPARAIALPPRPSVGSLYLAADVLLHAARSEGAGSVLAEAMANGLPTLCTELCGFSHLVAPAGIPPLPSPFHQEEMNQRLAETLGRLPACRRQAWDYGSQQDFCRRAEAIIDLLEEECS